MNAFWASENLLAFMVLRSSSGRQTVAEHSRSGRSSFQGSEHLRSTKEEDPCQIVDVSISGARVARYLDDLALLHGLPEEIVLDTVRRAPAAPCSTGRSVPVSGCVSSSRAFLVKNFALKAKGHGVPEVMDAIYYSKGRIRSRVAVVKWLASAISIGSGGSVGREGPIVQIGSAFGSTLGTIISMCTQDRITLIAAGSGSGIAATFNAPIGSLAFGIELPLVSINARSLVIVATATAFASYISRVLLDTHPSFYVPALEVPDFYLAQPWALVAFFVLGSLMGLLSVAFIKGLYRMEDLFDVMPGTTTRATCWDCSASA